MIDLDLIKSNNITIFDIAINLNKTTIK